MAAETTLTYWVLLCWTGVFAEQCIPKTTSAMKFSIVSRRNRTGHWIAQVQLEYGVGPREAGPWEVDIDHSVANCGKDESVIITANVAAAPKRLKPPADYELLSNFEYYKFHTTPKFWNDARLTCASEGAHMLIINSNSEFEALKPVLDRHPNVLSDWRNPYSFVGISSLPTKEFFTIFNESFNATGYTNWASGQPNYDGNCVVVQRNGALHDTSCEIAFPFFCEFK